MLRHCESSSAVCGLEKRHLIFNMGGGLDGPSRKQPDNLARSEMF
ncbi:hypothetical protein RK21_01801 [Pseudomonas plecoglossicida]|nr:hypothetical protein RK21_01801 [Pseudomonas plecoglossicida]